MSGKAVHLIAIDKKKSFEISPSFNELTAVFFLCPAFPSPVVHIITLSHRHIFYFLTGMGFGCLLCPLRGFGGGRWEGRETESWRLTSESNDI